MYIYMYICTNIYTHTHVYIHMYTHICIYMYVYICIRLQHIATHCNTLQQSATYHSLERDIIMSRSHPPRRDDHVTRITLSARNAKNEKYIHSHQKRQSTN